MHLVTLNTPYLSTFICPPFTSPHAVFHSSPSVSLSISVPFHFLPPHVVLLSIPLYSFPPSPPLLSSLAHIWFPSLGLCVCVCVFGVTQSSPGLPAHMGACFADGDRETACVHVCELRVLLARSCFCMCVCVFGRVQRGKSRLCNCFRCRPFRRGMYPLHVYLPVYVQFKNCPRAMFFQENITLQTWILSFTKFLSCPGEAQEVVWSSSSRGRGGLKTSPS